MYDGHTIAAVIPAYNEEPFIGTVIESLPSFVDRAYVIDDASTDDTWTEIQSHAAEINDRHRPDIPVTDGGVELSPRVVPIQHDENRGVGGAIKTGYQAARDDEVDVTVVVCGDGQTDPDSIERIIQPVVAGVAGYAKGDRLRNDPSDAMPAFRRVGNVMLTWLTRIASGYWQVTDPQNGTTAISKAALDAASIDDMYEGYGYCNDLLARLNVAEVTVADVPHRPVYDDEESGITYETYIPRVSMLLLQNFVWRLIAKYGRAGIHPVPLTYSIGALSIGGALLADITARLGGDGGGRPGSVLGVVLGVVAVLAGMALDRRANRELTTDDEW